MTKDEALDLALEALELSAVTVDSFGVQKKTQEAITAIKQALAAPVQEPVQPADKCAFQIELKASMTGGSPYPAWVNTSEMERLASQLKKVGDRITLYTNPLAQPVPVQEPVAFEVSLVEWVGNKLMATPKVTATPPASWMETVTANLVREGVNKHKARELAEHFYGLKENT